ncbi:hypothetical protein C4556_02060 [Candidatus Parcubacteria bacterium]|nr:MAG: hypothetical protein C4556_02060 [Candidatus Parcubacteria bacterium]
MAVKKEDLVKFILDRNKAQSKDFCSPGAQLGRRLYRAQHPSEIIALKCMDGRLNLSIMTNTPPGIIKPYRNIGGKFDLGWPFFGRLILDDVEYSVSKGRPTVVLSTYHFSKGDTHRGCAGHGYDTGAARKGAFRLAEQFKSAFGGNHVAVFPMVVAIETDEGGLVFHGEGKETFDVANHADASADNIHSQLRHMYPEVPDNIIDDLLPLVAGNQKYVKAIRASKRPVVEMEHKEQIIAVGRGFDWLHLPNRALMIGPYDPDWENAVATAGKIILGNMKAKRVPEKDGALLLVLAPFRTIGADAGVAVEKAEYLAREAEKVLKEQTPTIMKKLRILVGTVDMNTRNFYQLMKK